MAHGDPSRAALRLSPELDGLLGRRWRRLLCHKLLEAREPFAQGLFDHPLEGGRGTRTALARAREPHPNPPLLYSQDLQLAPVGLEVGVDALQRLLDLRPLVGLREVVHLEEGAYHGVARYPLGEPGTAELGDEAKQPPQGLPVQDVYALEEGEDLLARLRVLYPLHPFQAGPQPVQQVLKFGREHC